MSLSFFPEGCLFQPTGTQTFRIRLVSYSTTLKTLMLGRDFLARLGLKCARRSRSIIVWDNKTVGTADSSRESSFKIPPQHLGPLPAERTASGHYIQDNGRLALPRECCRRIGMLDRLLRSLAASCSL